MITVTGRTGTIGNELARLLGRSGTAARAVFRDQCKVQLLPGIAWVQADLRDADLLEPVLAGITRRFLLTDNQPSTLRT